MPKLWPKAQIPLPPSTQPSWHAPAQALIDLSAGDTAAAAHALRAAVGFTLPPAIDALRRVAEGRLVIARGDAAGGMRMREAATRDALRAGPHPAGPPLNFYEVILAIELASYAPTRSRGIEELRALLDTQGFGSPFAPLLQYHPAGALEAEGEREAAIREYAWFLTLTSRAEGNFARLHEKAREAHGWYREAESDLPLQPQGPSPHVGIQRLR